MKLIIQIPCYNEAETLPALLKELPRKIDGFDQVEWLVIDDGSTDDTADVARKYGVDHVISSYGNKGLANAFATGINGCIDRGADVIVNTDADNQYKSSFIDSLVIPIMAKKADMVIGCRPIGQIKHFSSLKKILQGAGSAVVRMASNTDVADAPSGFRAFSRDAAMRLNVFGTYTYTLETIIQAGQKGLSIVCVPVDVNPPIRPSRLMKGVLSYIMKSAFTILRMFVVYCPLKFFISIAAFFIIAGVAIGGKFIYHFIYTGSGSGHVQSLILSSILIGVGFQVLLFGFLADLIATNRKLSEDILYHQKKASGKQV